MLNNRAFFCSLIAATSVSILSASADEIAWAEIIGGQKSQLTAAQKTRVEKLLLRTTNTYGCKGTLAQCIAKGDLTAKRHGGFVIRMVKKGKDDAFINKHIALRHASSHPDETFAIDVENSPRKGARGAPVRVVEYACFQCPFCAHLAPSLQKLHKRFGKKIVQYYKYFPVISHPRGVPAAVAAVAAEKQGKFWPMYDMLFKNRADLEDKDLLNYAGKLGLDVKQFEKDIRDPASTRKVEKDKLEGMRFGVDGTPTFFINGKMYKGVHDYDEIADRIAEEIDIVEGRIR
jgi:protein-disulfide isomerase